MQMETQNIILSRLLPKTNQENTYITGDDGIHEAGWWKGKTVANNRKRFIEYTLSGDDVVKDLATGLMWARDGDEGGCGNGSNYRWDDACLFASGMPFAGFSDWRVPNILEMISIVDFAKTSAPFSYSIFTNTASAGYWSSTTAGANNANAWAILFNTEFISPVAKTGTIKFRGVRSI